MARGPNRNKVLRVKPTISAQQMDYLEQLVEIGNYGNTPTAVALYLIQSGIDDLLGRGLVTRKRRKATKQLSKQSSRRNSQRTG